MSYHIEKVDARFKRKVYYSGNNQWNSKFEYRLVFSTEAKALKESNNVRGTIVEE